MSAPTQITALRQRFLEIVRRHIDVNDVFSSDDEFVRDVFKRYEHGRRQPLIDPNE